MKTHILIFGCSRDVPYLEYCLKSIRKFAAGFSGVTIGVAKPDEGSFFSAMSQVKDNIGEPRVQLYDAPPDPAFGHLAHQAQKGWADKYTPSDADLVCMIDSDNFFITPVTPDDYIQNRKPVLCMEEYSTMIERPWQEQTSRALGINAKWEVMRRHANIYHRAMFPEFRAEIERVHKRPFTDYVLGGKADFPWHYSDHNALGNYALTSHWKERYHFIDVGREGYPPHKLLDVWSHAAPDQAQGNRYRGLFPETMTVKEIWTQLGL